MSDADMDKAVKALRDMAAGDFVDSRRRLKMAKTLLPKVEALAKREAVAAPDCACVWQEGEDGVYDTDCGNRFEFTTGDGYEAKKAAPVPPAVPTWTEQQVSSINSEAGSLLGEFKRKPLADDVPPAASAEVPDGYVLVPVEPTFEMLLAMQNCGSISADLFRERGYPAMLAAAQKEIK